MRAQSRAPRRGDHGVRCFLCPAGSGTGAGEATARGQFLPTGCRRERPSPRAGAAATEDEHTTGRAPLGTHPTPPVPQGEQGGRRYRRWATAGRAGRRGPACTTPRHQMHAKTRHVPHAAERGRVDQRDCSCHRWYRCRGAHGKRVSGDWRAAFWKVITAALGRARTSRYYPRAAVPRSPSQGLHIHRR